MSEREQVKGIYESLRARLDERSLRLWAAAQAQALGRGGITVVAQATGMSRTRIGDGLRELSIPVASRQPSRQRTRRSGGGRKRLPDTDPTLLSDLDALVSPTTRGDPMSPLRWTCKSLRHLAQALRHKGHPITAGTVARLLREQKYSLQANRKVREGGSHPDRNAQFEHISAQCQQFQQRGQPAVSVDAKKKELVGNFKNGGQEWRPGGCPEEVNVHDFPDKEQGKVTPYGVLDIATNEGWVSVGTDHDTAAFAVQTLRTWWEQMGCQAYPDAEEVLVAADGGGSNGSRSRLWKRELQRWADESSLRIQVCHLPPGTSKWNQIEHRMFSHITQNWRGRPLVSHEVVVSLIANTRTETGLRIRAALDKAPYPTGIEVTDEEMGAIRIERAAFHGEWNYTILPRISPN
ncbi:MAG: ISAzo13 family transposase [Candidatus Dormibacteria bacterium]